MFFAFENSFYTYIFPRASYLIKIPKNPDLFLSLLKKGIILNSFNEDTTLEEAAKILGMDYENDFAMVHLSKNEIKKIFGDKIDRICYTYGLLWKKDNIKYIGVSTTNRYPSDLFNSYFTSSKDVKEKRNIDGPPDFIGIDRCFLFPQDAKNRENELFQLENVRRSSIFLNNSTHFYNQKSNGDSLNFIESAKDVLNLDKKRKIDCSLFKDDCSNHSIRFHIFLRELLYYGIMNKKSFQEIIENGSGNEKLDSFRLFPTILGIINFNYLFSDENLYSIFLGELEEKYSEMKSLFLSDIIEFVKSYSINYLWKIETETVYIPFTLAQEIVDSLSKDEKPRKNILVWNSLSGILPLLLKVKYPDSNITLIESNPYYISFLKSLNYFSEVILLDDNNPYSLDDSFYLGSKQFDVVVGNPPYTDGSKAANVIWDKFIDISLPLLKKDSIFSMVVTQSFAVSERYSELRKKLIRLGLSKVVFLPQSTFPIQQTTLYFIVDKASKDIENTSVVNLNKSYNCKVDDVIFKEEILKSIISNISSKLSNDYFSKSDYLFKPEECVEEDCQMVTLINPHYCRIEKGNFRGEHTDKHKIIARYLHGYNADVLKSIWYCPPGVSTGKIYRSMIVENEMEGKVLESLFRSKLFLAIFLKTFTSRTLDGLQLRFLPKMDLSRMWSNEDLFEYFSLTKEQIDYIEDVVQ